MKKTQTRTRRRRGMTPDDVESTRANLRRIRQLVDQVRKNTLRVAALLGVAIGEPKAAEERRHDRAARASSRKLARGIAGAVDRTFDGLGADVGRIFDGSQPSVRTRRGR